MVASINYYNLRRQAEIIPLCFPRDFILPQAHAIPTPGFSDPATPVDLWLQDESLKFVVSMPSKLDEAKRALVKLLRSLAVTFKCEAAVCNLSRDSSDTEVKQAFKKLARKVHPDKPRGSNSEFQRLSAATTLGLGWWQEMSFNFHMFGSTCRR